MPRPHVGRGFDGGWRNWVNGLYFFFTVSILLARQVGNKRSSLWAANAMMFCLPARRLCSQLRRNCPSAERFKTIVGALPVAGEKRNGLLRSCPSASGNKTPVGGDFVAAHRHAGRSTIEAALRIGNHVV